MLYRRYFYSDIGREKLNYDDYRPVVHGLFVQCHINVTFVDMNMIAQANTRAILLLRIVKIFTLQSDYTIIKFLTKQIVVQILLFRLNQDFEFNQICL